MIQSVRPAWSSVSVRTAAARIQGGIGLFFLLSFVAFAVLARFPSLYRDDWHWLYAWLTYGPSLGALTAPHNEHIVPLPRLLYAVQFRLAGADGRLLFASALAAQLVLGWVFWREVRRRWVERAEARFVWGAGAVFLYFTYQLQAIVFMGAVVFSLVEALAVLAIVSVLNATEPRLHRQLGWTGLTLLASTGAALTATNGLVVPFVVAALAIVRGRRIGLAATLAATGVICFLGYIWLADLLSLQTLRSGAIGGSAERFSEIARFSLSFLASGFIYGSETASLVLGAVLFGAGVAALWLVARDRRHAPRAEFFATALMLFTIATHCCRGPIPIAVRRVADGAVAVRHADLRVLERAGSLARKPARVERMVAAERDRRDGCDGGGERPDDRSATFSRSGLACQSRQRSSGDAGAGGRSG